MASSSVSFEYYAYTKLKPIKLIEVCNGYINGWNSGHYVGRGGKGKKGSALANPFKLKDSRDVRFGMVSGT